jgi:3-hydroxyisobutyrate dehydrogenase-like beta-hydroxyacid dehydrogenase
MGQKTLDRHSQASLVRLAGNFLITANIECLGEAFALVRKSGIDPHIAFLRSYRHVVRGAPYHIYGSILADESTNRQASRCRSR